MYKAPIRPLPLPTNGREPRCPLIDPPNMTVTYRPPFTPYPWDKQK